MQTGTYTQEHDGELAYKSCKFHPTKHVVGPKKTTKIFQPFRKNKKEKKRETKENIPLLVTYIHYSDR